MLLLSLLRQYCFFLFFLFFLLLALQPSESLAAQKYFKIWQSGDGGQSAELPRSGKVTVTPGSSDEPAQDEQPEGEPTTGSMGGFAENGASSQETPQSLPTSGAGASPENGEEEEANDVIVEYDAADAAPSPPISITHLSDQDANLPEPQVEITYGSTVIYAFLLDDWLATQSTSANIISVLQSENVTPFWVNMPPTVLPDSIGNVIPVFQVSEEGGVLVSGSGQVTIFAELLNCHNCSCTAECSHQSCAHEYNCLNCDCCSIHGAAATPTNACKAKKVSVVIKLSTDNTQVSIVSFQTGTHFTVIQLSDTPFDENQGLQQNLAMITAFITAYLHCTGLSPFNSRPYAD